MTALNALLKLLLSTALAGVLCAVAIAPIAGLGGIAVARTNEAMQSDIADLAAGNAQGVSVIKDSTGAEIAYLYNQRRYPVASAAISQFMKDAIVSIEDRRFYEHQGVDIPGNVRAVVTNLLHGGVSQGASTLDQQYVKNYLLLVDATSEKEQQAATEQSVGRKLREIRMATQLDRSLGKDEVLTNYLNLVPFGNHAYGIEAAALTYFGIPAKHLTLAQAAMLAGMVQSSSYLNPYTNHDAVLQRRNTVLRSMVDNGYISPADAATASISDLGVLPQPALLSNGCISAGDRGFFCDYVLSYLEKHGLSTAELARGGYTVTTTLDPAVQAQAKAAVVANVNPRQPGVAEVLNVIAPVPDFRPVLAMVSSRTYGLNQDNFETSLPQPHSLVGNGAGSVFKVFTAAAALDTGYGSKEPLPVPARYEAEGIGFGGAQYCPPRKYCVENAGNYRSVMSLEDALAFSPNTPFIALTEQLGVPRIVDMSVQLGLRSYLQPGSFNASTALAQAAKNPPMGAYTLGPTAVNPLELANVGATLAAGGQWCEPTPIAKVTDRTGAAVLLNPPPCERVLDVRVADALSNALQKDALAGTAADTAKALGFNQPVAAKTGTTESNLSSAFLGFNSALAAAPYIYNDGTSVASLCTAPVRQCPTGNLFGGLEPARTFFQLAKDSPLFRSGHTPPYDHVYDQGSTGLRLLDEQRGKTVPQARKALEDEGYKVAIKEVTSLSAAPGQVAHLIKPEGELKEGMTIVLAVADAKSYNAAPPVAPAPVAVPAAPAAPVPPQPTPLTPRPGDTAGRELENQLSELANQLIRTFAL